MDIVGRFLRSSLSAFTYCKRSKAGVVEGLGIYKSKHRPTHYSTAVLFPDPQSTHRLSPSCFNWLLGCTSDAISGMPVVLGSLAEGGRRGKPLSCLLILH